MCIFERRLKGYSKNISCADVFFVGKPKQNKIKKQQQAERGVISNKYN